MQLKNAYTVPRRPRDSQKAKVYRWENSQWWMTQDLQIRTYRSGPDSSVVQITGLAGIPEFVIDLTQCQQLVARLWSEYPHRSNRDRAPRVKDGRGHRNATGSRYAICLPRWARTVPVVCHELAHSICASNLKFWEEAGHGPTFVGVYCQLLEMAGVTRALPTMMSAIDAGLEVNTNPKFF